MNRHESEPPIPGLAKVVYGDGEYRVVVPGAFVVCAVTGRRVPLDELRYWSVERQEAYASAEIASEHAAGLKG